MLAMEPTHACWLMKRYLCAYKAAFWCVGNVAVVMCSSLSSPTSSVVYGAHWCTLSDTDDF